MCQIMQLKSAKLQHYSFSQQNSVKCSKDFTWEGIFLHQHCWNVGTFLHLCLSSNGRGGDYSKLLMAQLVLYALYYKKTEI